MSSLTDNITAAENKISKMEKQVQKLESAREGKLRLINWEEKEI